MDSTPLSSRCAKPHCTNHSTDRYTASQLRSEEHTSELQSLRHLVCRLLLEKKKRTFQKQDQNQERLFLQRHFQSTFRAFGNNQFHLDESATNSSVGTFFFFF